jgi:hypothetical protein
MCTTGLTRRTGTPVIRLARNTCRWRCPTNDNSPYLPPDVGAYLDAHPDAAAEFARVHGLHISEEDI